MIPPAGAADPTKLAAPKPVPGAKSPGNAPVDEKTYVIGAQDVLDIQVWEQQGLACKCLVRPDGMISMPFLGDILAAGRTPDDLRKDIADRLKNLIKDPQVAVGLSEVRSKRYFIQGEVNKPGESFLIVPTTVMQGLVAAGGFRDFADTKHITIIRGTQRLSFNYNEVLKGKNLKQNIYLQPDDIIVVK